MSNEVVDILSRDDWSKVALLEKNNLVNRSVSDSLKPNMTEKKVV